MADPLTDSPSHRLFQNNGYADALTHATPAHSAENSLHSFRSSTSSRTPLHTLSLHEYRKLQRTPTPTSQPPPGKSLRRKAAASELKELKRAPSAAAKSNSAASFISRPLHFSISLQQIAGYQPLPPSPPHCTDHFDVADKSYRSGSAEPAAFGGVNFVGGFHKETQKVGQWKTIKKLPRPRRHPRSPLPSAHIPPHAIVTPLSSSHSISSSITENAPSSDAPTTSSTLSLSRFPQPPHFERFDSPSSPDLEVNTLPRMYTSFTVAPATPPATPAVIHYRGTPFDLVNPHDSLLLHDIETPSKDLDSVDGSPVQTSKESLAGPEMAPPKKVYTDLGAAWSSIRRRDEPEESHVHHPYTELSPPPPAVLSPRSPEAASPGSPDESSPALPSSVGRREHPGFSLRDLAPIRHLSTFTRRLNRASEAAEEQVEEQELEELPTTRPASTHEGHQPVYDDEDCPTPASTYQPIESFSYSPLESTSGLRSMLPDQSFDQRASASESLYPASSVYSNEGRPMHGYYSRRMTGAFGLEGQDNTDPFHRPSTYLVADPIPGAEYLSGQGTEAASASGADTSGTDHPDTLSHIVGQYEGTEYGMSGEPSHTLVTGRRSALHHLASQTQDLSTDSSLSSLELPGQVRQGRGRRPTLSHTPEPPTPRVASVESPFRYDDFFNSQSQSAESASAAATQELEPSSSYPQSDTHSTARRQQLEPSSAYSETEMGRTPPVPQPALDHAERIFDEAGAETAIPAMWRQPPGGHVIKRRSTIAERNEEDWETVGNKSQASAIYDDSIADFSSNSGDERDEHGMFKGVASPTSGDRQVTGFYEPSSQRPPRPAIARRPDFGTLRGGRARQSSQRSRVTFDLPVDVSTPASIPQQPVRHGDGDLSQEEFQELLLSGPSDEIIYNDRTTNQPSLTGVSRVSPGEAISNLNRGEDTQSSLYSADTDLLHYSPLHESYNSAVARHRQEPYQKLTGSVPKANLTGTPQVTGMEGAGGSIADNSSPGVHFDSGGSKRSPPVGYAGPEVYADTEQTSSKVVTQPESQRGPAERMSSEHTLSTASRQLNPRDPRGSRSRVVVPSSSRPSEGASHGHRRSAVTGQTTLRKMTLVPSTASSTRSVRSVGSNRSNESRVTRMSDMIRLDAPSVRAPSSINTNTPLTRPSVIPGHRPGSPHLRVLGRKPTAEDRAERSRLSWMIFGLLCLLPPLLILYRWLGDSIVTWVSGGRFNAATVASKRAALYLGVPINILILIAIAIPIFIALA